MLNRQLSEMLVGSGKKPESARRSMMTGCIFGKNESALDDKLSARKRTAEELRERGAVAGNAAEVREQLRALEQAGLQRIMLQWLDLDDLEGMDALADAVL